MEEHEAIKSLNEIKGWDVEADHSDADSTLLEFLRTNGHVELAEAWQRVSERTGGFWYA